MYSQLIKIKSFSQSAIIDVFYDAHKFTPDHVDEYHRISLILSGQLKESSGNQEEYAQSGSLVVKPKDVNHENIFGPQGTRILSVVFKNNFENGETVFGDWRWFHGLPVATTVFDFAEALNEVQEEEDLLDLVFRSSICGSGKVIESTHQFASLAITG